MSARSSKDRYMEARVTIVHVCDVSLNLRRHSLKKNAKTVLHVCIYIGYLKMMCGLFWLRSAAVI